MRKIIKAFEALGCCRNNQEEIEVCAALGAVCMENMGEAAAPQGAFWLLLIIAVFFLTGHF